MTSAESSDRTVCPHALVKASGRYHVRAFDFSRKRFIDFSLSRVLSSTPLADDPSVPSRLDDDWYAMIDVELKRWQVQMGRSTSAVKKAVEKVGNARKERQPLTSPRAAC